MKKRFFALVLVFIVAAGVSLSACDKEREIGKTAAIGVLNTAMAKCLALAGYSAEGCYENNDSERGYSADLSLKVSGGEGMIKSEGQQVSGNSWEETLYFIGGNAYIEKGGSILPAPAIESFNRFEIYVMTQGFFSFGMLNAAFFASAFDFEDGVFTAVKKKNGSYKIQIDCGFNLIGAKGEFVTSIVFEINASGYFTSYLCGGVNTTGGESFLYSGSYTLSIPQISFPANLP